MKKKIDKIKSKKLCKNVVYVAVLLSIIGASLASVLSFTKTMESSADEEDIQKIFSVDNDTLACEAKDDGDKVIQEDHGAREVISFIRQDAEDKDVATKGTSEREAKEDGTTKDIPKEEKKEDVATEDIPKVEVKEDVATKDTSTKEVFFGGSTSCIVPLNGDVVKEYSGDKLVYFKSKDEWRVHRGIDIKASVGTSVKAVMDGYVDMIENNGKDGVTVVIKHSNREKSVYKNLANQDLVLPNQIIKQGDVIGVIGDVVGCGGDSHLHFEIIKNDRAVDPKKYIQFSSK